MDLFAALLAKSLTLKEVFTKTEAQEMLAGKADLVNGAIPLSQIPPAAIERLVTVNTDTDRFLLTSNDVQLGDTVKVISTDKMYLVTDINKLSSEDGYQIYVAGRAVEAIADQNGNVIDTTYMKKADGKRIWEGSAEEYAQLQTDSYDLYFIEEGGEEGRSVPEGYELLTFFDNESRYSLNTQFKPQSGSLSFEGKVAVTGYEGDIVGGFDADPYSLRDAFSIWLYCRSSGGVTLETHPDGAKIQSSESVMPLDVPFKVAGLCSAGIRSLTVDGNTTTISSGRAALARDVWIGSNGAYGSSVGAIKLYYFKFYDGDTRTSENLRRDLVPVKRLSDDTYGCWDFVTQQFYAFGS